MFEVESITRVLGHGIQVDLFGGDGEELMLSGNERSHLIAQIGVFGFAVGAVGFVHDLGGDSPSYQVEPALTLHSQFYAAFVAYEAVS